MQDANVLFLDYLIYTRRILSRA